MIKEYWINVYHEKLFPNSNNNQGAMISSKELANHISEQLNNIGYWTIYRIHVRLK